MVALDSLAMGMCCQSLMVHAAIGFPTPYRIAVRGVGVNPRNSDHSWANPATGRKDKLRRFFDILLPEVKSPKTE